MTHRLLAPLAAAPLVGGILLQTGVTAAPVRASSAQPGFVAQQVSTTTVTGTTRNLFSLPRERYAAAKPGVPRQMPLMPLGPNKTRTKAGTQPGSGIQSVSPQTEGAGAALRINHAFDGMADSASICPYFGGCQPPDMALATSPNYVFQGVNTSYTLYDTSGTIIAGPVNAQDFFGVPNPSPSGCDPNGPFLSDPRAFYDPNTGLMWAAILQLEGALGIAPGCYFTSKIWLANLDPSNGVMHVYNFDTPLGTKNANDYTLLGFNATTIGLSVNMFNKPGTAYEGSEELFINKHAMELGQPVKPVAFTKLTVGGVPLDTIQPVETETPVAKDPGVLYLVSSFNSPDLSGSDCFTKVCHGFVVVAYDPSTKSLSHLVVPASNMPYLIPPNADQPGCTECIETIDARITGTPVYTQLPNRGLISFAHGSAVFNGTQVVPAAQWVQLNPMLSGHSISAVSVYQAGTLALGGDQALSFPAIMPDAQNNIVLLLDTMGHLRNPSIMVASRLASDPLGTMRAPTILKQGQAPTLDSRWGDFEAVSYDGFNTNRIWVASQYSASNQDWATWIAQVQP